MSVKDHIEKLTLASLEPRVYLDTIENSEGE